MGNDGGSIPTRRELVKEAARNPTATEIKESRHEQQEYHWTTDPISRKPLATPVVSDSNGVLYNKDTILEFLVEDARKEEAERLTLGTVKSLRDVVEVKFDIDGEAAAKVTDNAEREVWKCPITGDRLGAKTRAVYLVPCGHAFSATVVKEISGEKCLTCDTGYASNDIIPILPVSSEDIARLALRAKTLQEKGLTHSLKKVPGSKKRKKREDTVDAVAEKVTNGKPSASAIHNPSTASLTAQVLREQEQVKKRKTENENVRSLFSSSTQKTTSGKSADFMTRGFSIPAGAKR